MVRVQFAQIPSKIAMVERVQFGVITVKMDKTAAVTPVRVEVILQLFPITSAMP